VDEEARMADKKRRKKEKEKARKAKVSWPRRSAGSSC
jgi:hypothetical protein